MPSEVPTARQLVHQLVPRELTDASDVVFAAAREACESVSVDFTRWVGPGGYDALISRALSEARTTYPALALIHYEVSAEPHIGGVAECLDRHGADVAAQALLGLLETIFALLGRLIGNDLVAALVDRSMEARALDDRRSQRHVDSGSSAP